MKYTDDLKKLKEMNLGELVVQLASLRRDLFNIRLNATTAHVKDYSQFKKMRKDIARVQTVIRQFK